MMDDLDFTEEEIREQLEKLGYYDVPTSRLAEFKRDLEKLVSHERSKNGSWTTCSESGSSDKSHDVQRKPVNGAGSRSKCSDGLLADHPHFDKENLVYDRAGHQSAVVTRAQVAMPTALRDASMYSVDTDTPGTSRARGETPGTSRTHVDTPGTGTSRTPGDVLDTTGERRLMKRRVLRRRAGRAEISDELTETETDSEADSVSGLGDRLDELRLREVTSVPPPNHPNHFDPYQNHLYAGGRATAASHADGKGPARFGLPVNYHGPTSLIKSMAWDPHTRNIHKMDPVARFQKYRQSWQCQHPPGENTHKSLRWNVRAQMLYHDPVIQKKVHKVFVPNKYVIPSDKKRKSLRWQVRQDLAQGVMPPSYCD